MSKATFLIPVASAVASIAGAPAHASVPAQAADAAAKTPSTASTDTLGTLLTYVRGNEQHQTLMKRDESGTVLAYHQSHSSHYSHSSHSSHRSSAY